MLLSIPVKLHEIAEATQHDVELNEIRDAIKTTVCKRPKLMSYYHLRDSLSI